MGVCIHAFDVHSEMRVGLQARCDEQQICCVKDADILAAIGRDNKKLEAEVATREAASKTRGEQIEGRMRDIAAHNRRIEQAVAVRKTDINERETLISSACM